MSSPLSPLAFVSDYQGLITSEHNQQPNFMAWVAACVQPFVDIINLVNNIPNTFDIDLAVGDQLDIIGRFVGQSRNIEVPLAGVYFSFGIPGVGFGEGTWFAPGDSVDGLTTLPDDTYRILLYAVIARNFWDGTVPGAYAVWSLVFGPVGGQIFIVDHQDMTISLIFYLPETNAVINALIANSFLDMVPAGVLVTGYYQPSGPLPMFGFGQETGLIAGFGVGSWVETLTTEEGVSEGIGGLLITQSPVGDGFITKRLY